MATTTRRYCIFLFVLLFGGLLPYLATVLVRLTASPAAAGGDPARQVTTTCHPTSLRNQAIGDPPMHLSVSLLVGSYCSGVGEARARAITGR